MDRLQPDNASHGASTAGFYDEFWQRFDSELNGDERSRITSIALVLERHPLPPRSSILDLGCGRGWMAPRLAKYGGVTGIDFSPVGIEMAQKHFGGFATFLLADPSAANLGLPEGEQYDLVVASEVIEHVADSAGFVRQLFEMVRPGGMCILTTPNGHAFDEYFDTPFGREHKQPTENWLTPQELAKVCATIGFECVEQFGIVVPGFRMGRWKTLQRKKTLQLAERTGLLHAYNRFLLPHALNQLVACRKPQP